MPGQLNIPLVEETNMALFKHWSDNKGKLHQPNKSSGERGLTVSYRVERDRSEANRLTNCLSTVC